MRRKVKEDVIKRSDEQESQNERDLINRNDEKECEKQKVFFIIIFLICTRQTLTLLTILILHIHLQLHYTAYTHTVYTSKKDEHITLLTILTLYLHLHCTTHFFYHYLINVISLNKVNNYLTLQTVYYVHYLPKRFFF